MEASVGPLAGTRVRVSGSFEDFYKRSYPEIAHALSVTLRDPDLGAEAADEAMARAYPRWDKVANLDKPEAWVYRVGLNWASSLRRKLARRLPFQTAVATSPEQVSDPALEDALEALTKDMRAVIVCRYLLDWSIEDTAAALHIRTGTVKSRTNRALSILAVQLRHMREVG